MDSLLGIPVFESRFLPERRVQVRFPKSRKKRVRKKWAKRKENWRVEEYAICLPHPIVKELMQKPQWTPQFLDNEKQFINYAQYAGVIINTR